MFVLKALCTPRGGVLQLQEVRLREVHTCCTQRIGVLLFESLTYHEVGVMQTNGTVPSQRILNQGIGILAMSLGQTLVLLGQIYTVTLNPCRNPGLVVARCRAVREVDFIGQLVILALDSQHAQQVYISRSCTHETVYNRVTRQQIVDQQGVHG